jgi:hypothetical protein
MHKMIKASEILQSDLIVASFDDTTYNVFSLDYDQWTGFFFDKKIMSIGNGYNEKGNLQLLTKTEADIFCDLLRKQNCIRYEVRSTIDAKHTVISLLYLFVKEVEEAEDDKIVLLATDNSKPSISKKYTLSSNQDVFLVDRRRVI